MSTRQVPVADDTAGATVDGRRCPHCGAGVEETLAVHLARDCRRSDWSDGCRKTVNPHAQWEHMPALEDAPATVTLDERDLAARRQLADRLARRGTVLDE